MDHQDDMPIPADVQQYLDQCSRTNVRTAGVIPEFTCKVFNSPWDQFVELWAPRIFRFVGHALGPYAVAPLPEIKKLPDGMHSAGATASFEPSTGQVRLATSVEGKPGQTLEKLCHEFIHGSLAGFPEGDPYYEEGAADYGTWIAAHAPTWDPYREQMIEAAAYNIEMRRERAFKDQTDYDRKRYSGGLFFMMARGPHFLSLLKMKKAEGSLTW